MGHLQFIGKHLLRTLYREKVYGLNLSSFFHLTNQNTGNSSNHNSITQTSTSQGASNYHVANAIRNLSAGQTISGEVVAIRDGEIDIALDKDTYLTAKLDRDMNLALGQTITFEVKSTAGNRIALSPLYENMAQNPTISNAIQAAHIPLNNTAASMVHIMMENGMPIDKESLQDMYRQIANHPEASGETIVQMNRLQIPVTPDNIAQFGMYKNYEHSIMEAAGTIGEELTDAFHQVVQNGTTNEVSDFLQKMVQIFGQDAIDRNNHITADGKVAVVEEGANKAELGATGNLMAEDILTEEKAQEKTQTSNAASNLTVENETRGMAGTTASNVAENSDLNTLKNSVNMMGQETMEGESQQFFLTQLGLSQGAANRLSNMLQQLGVSPELAEAIKGGAVTSEMVLQTVAELVQKTDKSDMLKTLLNSKELTNVIKGQVAKQWLLQPEDVAKEGKVEELYRRIQQQTAKLADSISGLAKDNSPLAKSVSNLSSNVEFMNQLNQVFTYVQLPLKMSNGKAHGELYVYTNKKNLAKKDGNVSALLHLDMEHLGAMDIYVAMQQNKVNTKFYLEKEEYIDFIAENIHILDERLEKRGYSMKAEFIQKEGRTNMLDEMIQQNNNGNGMQISQYAFDARA